jgi:hypothetical protein
MQILKKTVKKFVKLPLSKYQLEKNFYQKSDDYNHFSSLCGRNRVQRLIKKMCDKALRHS